MTNVVSVRTRRFGAASAAVIALVVLCAACSSAPAQQLPSRTDGPVAPAGPPSVRPSQEQSRESREGEESRETEESVGAQPPGQSVNDRSAFPSDTDTGPTGPLAPYSGPILITQPDTVVENVEIVAPQVAVAANNVTFRNVRFVYSGQVDEKFAMVAIDPRFRGTVFEDCEIDGRNGTPRGIGGPGGVTVRRCDIHNTGNGIEVGEDFTVEDSYIHDIFTPKGLDWHADGIQSTYTGVQNIRIANNTIMLTGNETAAIHVYTKDGTSRNVEIAGNLVGGGGYTMYVGATQTENFVVADNAFSTEIYPNVGLYGPWFPYSRNVLARGNFMLGSGQPSSPPA